jgi:hypothetical protein
MHVCAASIVVVLTRFTEGKFQPGFPTNVEQQIVLLHT